MPLPIAARVMPIAHFLDTSEFDPETKRVMAVAFEMARAALQLGDQSILWERIAKRIIELAKTGELNPDVLCEDCVEGILPTPVGGGRLWRPEFVERSEKLQADGHASVSAAGKGAPGWPEFFEYRIQFQSWRVAMLETDHAQSV